MERLTTGNGLLGDENNNNNASFLRFDVLEDFISNFPNVIKLKNLQEGQFLIYNGKLKIENQQQDKSIEVKISFVQHYENDYIVLIFRDTTQRDLLLTLEETNRYKDQLLASVSHELRAPLNGNINLIEGAVNSPKIPEDVKESLLTPALRCSKFLLHIINDILDMSQIKQKKLRLGFNSADLKETLTSAAQLVEFQAKKKGIELQVDLDPNLPRDFCTDHLRLSQIVLNLLSNGIKFTREGMIKLTTMPINGGSWVKIMVEDSGIGISHENLKKLFVNYTHIEFEERQISNPTGVGLGLNIASNLVELLAPKDHPNLSVVSNVNQGSTFTFFIENKERMLEGQREIEGSENSCEHDVAEEFAGAPHPTFFSKLKTLNSSISVVSVKSEPEITVKCLCPKVLIVDDNAFNIMALETILGSLDIKCDSVYSGPDAIKKLLALQDHTCGKECKAYSVIFMDQEMPEMSGADTVREIKRLQSENLVPLAMRFIGCTAHKAKEEVDKFLASGLDSCIYKPVSLAMIKDILKGSILA